MLKRILLATALALLPTSLLHAQKISDLTAASALSTSDLTVVVQGGATKKATGAQIRALAIGAGAVSVASGKTATFSNTITIAGTDGSTLNVGAGGTLGALATVTAGTGVATAAGNATNASGGLVTFSGTLGSPSATSITTTSLGVGAASTDDTIRIQKANPGVTYYKTGGASNKKIYQVLNSQSSGVFEFNSANDDGTNPQTRCQMDFYGVGVPDFSCVGRIDSGGHILTAGGPLAFYKSDATTGHKRWQIQPDANDLNWQMVTDDGNTSTTFMTAKRSSNGALVEFVTLRASGLGIGMVTPEAGLSFGVLGASSMFQLNDSASPKLYIEPANGVGTRLRLSRAGASTTNERLVISNLSSVDFVAFNGNVKGVGIGPSPGAPTAYLQLMAGTATASTAPLKLTSGTNNTTAETGAVEYNGTNLFFTRSGTTRENVVTASAVNSVSPTSPNRTVTINIDGTTYYLAAKTTND